MQKEHKNRIASDALVYDDGLKKGLDLSTAALANKSIVLAGAIRLGEEESAVKLDANGSILMRERHS